MCRVASLLALIALCLTPKVAGAAKPLDRDYAAFARNILPSGQYGGISAPPEASRQARMFDALTPLFDSVTSADLLEQFKSERFGVGADGPGTRERNVPYRGVRIVRDAYHVPHVRSTTYDGGVWASGWIAAADRGLLLEQARYNARVAAIDAPGLSALNLITGLKTFVPSQATERELARQTGVLERAGKPGRRALRDIDTYTAGINAYLEKTGSTAKPWTRNDVFALNALKGQFLGQGGGDEARRSQLLAALQARLGADGGAAVYSDLRQSNDPERSTSIPGRFPYTQVPLRPRGNIVPDAGSVQLVAADGSAPQSSARAQASNALLIGARRSVTGRPLMVAGPQLGYYYPGFTWEIDMHAPGLVWRGATSVPLPGYLLIGRGADFANSLTSAGADIIDTYVETLCGGSDRSYLFKGSCRTMRTFDAGVIKGAGPAGSDQPVTFQRTVHGPVIGYATVDGVKVALSRKRSSYGRDALDILPFQAMSTGKVKSPATFVRAFARTPQTFNAFYLDDKHIAEFTTGRLPLRPPGVDPGLPVDGRGSYEWKGSLAVEDHPQSVDPGSGAIVNWNNVVARGFGSGDDDWSNGSVDRNQMLVSNLARLARGGKHTLATVTSAMNAAATQDVRGLRSVSTIARLLEGTKPPSPRDAQMLAQLVAWRDAQASRLDTVPADGLIDHPGAAIMDAAWRGIADAVLAPVLGPELQQMAAFNERFRAPGTKGVTSYQGYGWFGYVDKDLRTLLGDRVRGKFSRPYCGNGDLAACRASIWNALDAAGDTLRAAQATDDPAAWRADATAERQVFGPLPLTSIHYANRPNGIQQVISFKGHR